MEAAKGKLKLVLSSRRVARIEEFETGGPTTNSLMAWNGQLFTSRKRIVVYDYVFDDGQKRALKEAKELARSTGLVLQVTDLSRQSAVSKILRSGLGMIGAQLRLRPGAKAPPVEMQECDCVSSPVSRP